MSRCAICDGPAEKSSFKFAPLPFFTTDQRVYIPGGLRNNEPKSFPRCKNCHTMLQRGVFFIRKHLDFSIGGARGLRFWLFPSLDPSSGKELFWYVESKALYLKNLRSICDRLNTIEIEITKAAAETEEPPFLTYVALFYHLDQQGHMRILTSADGIYPSHLRKIVSEKSELDRKYPYSALPRFSRRLQKIHFGFPILADFWLHGGKPGGQKKLAELVSSIYQSSKVSTEHVSSTIIERIRDEFRGAGVKVSIKKMENLTGLSLKALITMEFLERMGVISIPESSVPPELKPVVEDRLTEELLKFLNERQKVIAPGVLRAICCAGVLTAITLAEQEKRIGSTSFWNRLNRLELSFERVMSLVPQAVEKLRQYRAMDRYRNLVPHILAREISHLDEKEAKGSSNDLISLLFTIGMGEGYLLTKLAEEEGE